MAINFIFLHDGRIGVGDELTFLLLCYIAAIAVAFFDLRLRVPLSVPFERTAELTWDLEGKEGICSISRI
jgi:hypothetical protein